MSSRRNTSRGSFVFRARDGVELRGFAVGTGRLLVLLHGGGPDHHSLVPLAKRLADRATVVLPDVRGCGRSICRDRERHTRQTYADDVVTLLDHLATERALVSGAGMGAGIAIRAGLSTPERVSGLVLISPEHRGEERPATKLVLLQQEMADRILTNGLEAAWDQWLPMMPAAMAAMVRDALPHADPLSQARRVARARGPRAVRAPRGASATDHADARDPGRRPKPSTRAWR